MSKIAAGPGSASAPWALSSKGDRLEGTTIGSRKNSIIKLSKSRQGGIVENGSQMQAWSASLAAAWSKLSVNWVLSLVSVADTKAKKLEAAVASSTKHAAVHKITQVVEAVPPVVVPLH